ncbi:hypothetical protein ZWY2020_055063 [Hordeum vulgare]|nr:hypothetical protein ZWY2020_055063 [Hordeum vulgare]
MERVSWQPLALLLLAAAAAVASSTEVGYDGRSMVIDGERRLLISGSIHYPRSTPEMWPDLIRKAKEGGLDAIETYVFWNGHEPRRRQYNFEGSYDIVRFFKEVQDAGMYAILRIGPYICGEWNYGGLPAWLRDISGMQFRMHNNPFEIENEYGNVMDKLNNDESASEYIHWCAAMANKQNVGVPWIMCQQDQDVPPNVINSCNGFYCHDWFPKRTDIPKIWTENWTGWFKAWDKPDFHRSEDIAFSVAMFFQTRGSLQNYYMYHGGTNFGRTSGGPYITTSYDYDALLMSNIRQPKYGHLKDLHNVLKSMEKILLHGDYKDTTMGNTNVMVTKYTLDNSSACFISNKFDDKEVNVTLDGRHPCRARMVREHPADCKTVAYNSAKIKTQASVMEERAARADRDVGDQSDYLWYRTSLEHKGESNYKLHVNTTGHELYAFVNGKLVGRHYAPNGGFVFQMETPVKLHSGKNYISLLSATIGLKNYGALFEMMPAGIETHLDKAKDRSQWRGGTIGAPPFTWYKATFEAPTGEEPVVADLLGLGKGVVWVNGNNLGRYWPSYVAADMDGCRRCDYRGTFMADGDGQKCLTGCNEPSQRFYHVPRSFLKAGEPNTMVLFEEAGGDPTRVSFHTVAVGAACAEAAEVGDEVALACSHGRTISSVDVASLGVTRGKCGAYQGGCESKAALAAFTAACVGKESCTVRHTEDFRAGSGCDSGVLTVQATC